MKDIVLIAPYEKMLHDAESLIEKQKYKNVGVLLGDLTDGISAAAKAVEEGAKVLISRGGTYLLIQYVSPVPVVEIKINVLDMANIIRELQPLQNTIGVVGYSNIKSGYDLLKELGKNVVSVELDENDNVADKIKKCIDAGATVIVGDAVTCRIGRELGYKCYLMESGEKSLQNAIEEALRICTAIEREDELLNKYRTLTDSVHDAVLATDENNIIVAMNAQASRIFGLSKKDMVNMPLEKFVQYGDVVLEIMKGVPLLDELRQIAATKVELSNYPISTSGKFHGSIAVFQDIAEVQTREKNIRQKLLKKGLVAKYTFNSIVHESREMENCIAVAKKICNYDSAVLIEGESGVGKELFAQSIHNASRRHRNAFVAVNCAALPPSLIESTLFGYAEGAFTGGRKGGSEGVFEMAHTGTLFLDEIGELPFEMQGRLLRVIQEREVMRIGGDSNIPLDVRLICATNKNLSDLVASGKFRNDLLYRLNTLQLYVPSLNERTDDIILLAKHFLGKFSEQYSKNVFGFTHEAVEFLKNHKYTGNVRELQNMIERAVIVCDGVIVNVDDFCAGLPQKAEAKLVEAPSENLPTSSDGVRSIGEDLYFDTAFDDAEKKWKSLKELESAYMKFVLAENGGNVNKTCKMLGINRTTLWRRLKNFTN